MRCERPQNTGKNTTQAQFATLVFFQVTGAFAELERNLIRERTRAGLASARQRGRRGGRPKAIDPETFTMAMQLYQAQTSSVQSICTRLGIARWTFYRYVATCAAKET
jgi:DNA invertase Pin-like site-specific DNA recombinase